MELNESFVVPAPLDQLWALLNDIERVAPCMPGFTLQESDHPNYRGLMKVKVGAISVQYDARITIAETDVVARRVVLKISGKELRGAGSVEATVTALCRDEGTQTAVNMAIEVQITGRVAQFGRGIIADVSSRMTEQFVARLNKRVLAPAEPSAETATETRSQAAPVEEAPLDLGSVAVIPVLKRAIPVLLAALAVGAVVIGIRRRREQ